MSGMRGSFVSERPQGPPRAGEEKVPVATFSAAMKIRRCLLPYFAARAWPEASRGMSLRRQ